jgi:DnaK suppressor protein
VKEDKLRFFENLLKERRAQIEKNILTSSKELKELADSETNDDIDFASISADKMVDQAISNQQAKEIEEIDYALEKIKKGTYGVCEMCEELIGLQRLKVKPQARYCIVCREIVEKKS